MSLRARCLHLLPTLCLALAALAAPPWAAGAEMQPPRPHLAADGEQARVIVKFREQADTARRFPLSAHAAAETTRDVAQRRADALGGRIGRGLTAGRALTTHAQVLTASGVDSATLARQLRADPDVEYAEVDQRRTRTAVPDDPLYLPAAGSSPSTGQWYLKTPTAAVARSSTELVSSIDAPAAWDVTTGSASVVVAVVDTGIRADHPDLAGKVLAGYDMVTNTTLANDGNGRDADPSDPGDYVTSSDRSTSTFSSCSVANSSWHGTMVAGLVGAATDNGVGMAGIGWNTRVLPVRVLGKCFGYDSDIVAGMRWAAGLSVPGVPTNPTPAKVLNLSLGGSGSCSSTYADAVSAITAAGATIVVAAGNSSGHAVGVPGNCSGVIAVGGLRNVGTKVGYSDLGPAVALAAPAGNCVNSSGACLFPMLSTTNTGATTPVSGAAGASYTDGTHYAVGTSFSAPLVAGTAALMLAANPTLTPARIATLLKSSARPFPTSGGTAGTLACQAPTGTDQLECYCTTSTCGAGMLDAGAAVRAAAAEAGAVAPSTLQARASASPALPDPAQNVLLSAIGSQADTGHGISGYQWTLLDGGGIVAPFSGDTAQATYTVRPSASGQFTVQLTITQDNGLTSSANLTVNVDALSVGVAAGATSVLVGDTVNFDAVNLALSAGRTLSSYGWSLLDDGGGVATGFGGAVNGSSATLIPVKAGSFTVRLTATDDLGKQATADVTVTVSNPASSSGSTTSSTTTTTASGGGGGGAMDMASLLGLGLALAAMLLPLQRFRRQRPWPRAPRARGGSPAGGA